MKLTLRLLFLIIIFLSGFYNPLNGQTHYKAAACDNEDFEAGPAGPVTTTSGVSGWSASKLIFPFINPQGNCIALTSTAVTHVNPVAADLFTVNGYVDSIIGPGYPIYSVFGNGAVNGGTLYNPGIGDMRGNSFFRIGSSSGVSYNHHAIEKTIAVTSANALFRFAYISVVKLGTSCCESPAVQVRFFNASQGNAQLSCPVYSVIAPNAMCSPVVTPPMLASTQTFITAYTAYYHKWKIEAVDLSPYIGSTIVFKMAVTYCSTGCAKYGYAYLDAQCGPMEILVNNTPFPAHTNSITFTGCGVQSATVVAPPDFSTYNWSGPGGFSSTLSTITTTTSGVYTLNINTSNTCSVITKYVTVNLFPTPSVSVVATTSTVCKGKSTKLVASGLSSYTWSIPANTATITITPTVTTTYSVSGYDANGCLASASITQSVISCVGITEKEPDAIGFSIYPNPNRGEFNLWLQNPANTALLYLTNSLGELVYSVRLKHGENKIKTNGLAKGLYYCSVEINGLKSKNEKLIID